MQMKISRSVLLNPDPPRRRSPQNEELLPQEEDLGLTSRVRSAQRCEQRAEVLENINHPGTRLADRQVRASPDELFGNDR